MDIKTYMKITKIKPSVIARILEIPQSQLNQYVYGGVIPGPEVMRKFFIITLGGVSANAFNGLNKDIFETKEAKLLLLRKERIMDE